MTAVSGKQLSAAGCDVPVEVYPLLEATMGCAVSLCEVSAQRHSLSGTSTLS